MIHRPGLPLNLRSPVRFIPFTAAIPLIFLYYLGLPAPILFRVPKPHVLSLPAFHTLACSSIQRAFALPVQVRKIRTPHPVFPYNVIL